MLTVAVRTQVKQHGGLDPAGALFEGVGDWTFQP